MLRLIGEPLFLFLSPFIAYVLFLFLRRRYPFAMTVWTRSTVSVLTLTGLAITVAGILVLGAFSKRYEGTYVPAHIENGRLVPGRME